MKPIRTNGSKKRAKVFAITGGKGGVGKTSISVNLAIALAKNGAKVCLFDADTGLANVNIMLGLHPVYTIEHLLTGEKQIADVLLGGPAGIDIVPGASGVVQAADFDVAGQARLIEALESIEFDYDYILLDTAAGISPTVLHFIASAQVAAVVVTPEPTSLTDAFSLLKVLRRRGYSRQVQVVVNMAANAKQADRVYRRFASAVKKYLDLPVEQLASFWMDESMRTAVTLQRPVTLLAKSDPSAKGFYRLAERVTSLLDQSSTPAPAFSRYWKRLVERSQKRASSADKVSSLPQRQDYGLAGPNVSLPNDVPTRENKPAVVVDLNRNGCDEALSRVQRQVMQQRRQQTEHESEQPKVGEPQTLLSDTLENEWVDLRARLNRLVNDENTTPEQVTTLVSSCIYAFGDRLGESAVDLIHGLLSTLERTSLSEEHKHLLDSECERLGLGYSSAVEQISSTRADLNIPILDTPKRQTELVEDDEVIRVEEPSDKVVYDESGFGSQTALAEHIRRSSNGVPLETLLESIKYASLVDSKRD